MKYWTFLFAISSSALFGCTDFVIETADGARINGRSLEFATATQSTLSVHTRKEKGASQTPEGKAGVRWISKYGYLAVTAFGMDLAMDGLNEAGLSIGFLWMPGYTEYQRIGPGDDRRTIDLKDVGSWLLGSFSTVAEVKDALKKVRVWAHPVGPLTTTPPVHLAVHDAEGNHLVVEFVKGEMKIYDNPIGVLTNSPPFDWQLIHLRCFPNLSSLNSDGYSMNGMNVQSPGEGSGMLGIPGDWTPPSRFIRAATYVRCAEQPQTAVKGVNLAEHLLNTFDIPVGEIREKVDSPGGDYTQWIVIKDLKNMVFYFRSYEDLALKSVDLKKIDWNGGSKMRAIPIDTTVGYVDLINHLMKQ